MHVLALDTTTRDGSVALVNEHRVVEEHRGDGARSHAERLPGETTRTTSRLTSPFALRGSST